MAVLTALLPLHLHLVGRELRAGMRHTVTAVVATAIAGFVLYRVLHAPAAMPPVLLLVMAFLGACVVFLVIDATPVRAIGLTPRRLRTQPIADGTYFALAAVGIVAQPAFWVVVAAQACALRPVVSASGGVATLVAAAAYVVAAALAAWAIALGWTRAEFIAQRRRAWRMLPAAGVLVVTLAFAAGLDIRRTTGEWTASLGGRTVRLWDPATDSGCVATALRVSPPGWIVRASGGVRALAVAAALAAVAGASLGAAVWWYRALVRAGTEPLPARRRGRRQRAAIGVAPVMPHPLAAAVARETRILWRTVEPRAGALLAALGTALLVVLPEVEPSFALIWTHVIVLANVAYAFNGFGLDAAGIDRLRLLPIASRDLVVAKNVAFAACIGMQVAPFVAVSAWRLGVTVAAVCLGAALWAVLAFAALGNRISVALAAPRDARAWGADESGELLGGIAGFALAAVNVALGLALLATPGRILPVYVAVFALTAGWCVYSWSQTGHAVDRGFEALRRRLRAGR